MTSERLREIVTELIGGKLAGRPFIDPYRGVDGADAERLDGTNLGVWLPGRFVIVTISIEGQLSRDVGHKLVDEYLSRGRLTLQPWNPAGRGHVLASL